MKKQTDAEKLMEVLQKAAPMLQEIHMLLRAAHDDVKRKRLVRKVGLRVVRR